MSESVQESKDRSILSIVEENNPAELRRLLKSKKTAEEDLNNALFKAAELGHAAMIRVLIQNGADVAAQNKKEFFPIAVAIQYNKLEAVELLLAYGAPLSSPFGRHTYLANGDSYKNLWDFVLRHHGISPEIFKAVALFINSPERQEAADYLSRSQPLNVPTLKKNRLKKIAILEKIAAQPGFNKYDDEQYRRYILDVLQEKLDKKIHTKLLKTLENPLPQKAVKMVLENLLQDSLQSESKSENDSLVEFLQEKFGRPETSVFGSYDNIIKEHFLPPHPVEEKSTQPIPLSSMDKTEPINDGVELKLLGGKKKDTNLESEEKPPASDTRNRIEPAPLPLSQTFWRRDELGNFALIDLSIQERDEGLRKK